MQEERENRWRGQLVEQLFDSSVSHAELPSLSDARADVDLVYRLFDLQKIIRFFGQRHWEVETAEFAGRGGLELENVAAHSFQVARSVSLLAWHFPWVDRHRATELALFHDEPELLTGDADPVGADGQGTDTHAFSNDRRLKKEAGERIAVTAIAAGMQPCTGKFYRSAMEELFENQTAEARFVKAIDKLQALAFVRLAKRGRISPDHTAFTIKYSNVGIAQFPHLQLHFACVFEDLLRDVASWRGPGPVNDFCQKTKLRLGEAHRSR